MHDTADTAQAEGEGQDGPDKPPHGDKEPAPPKSRRPSFITRLMPSRSGSENGRSEQSPPASRRPSDSKSPRSVPLPPPESGALPKEPGLTKGELGQIVLKEVASSYVGGSETPPSVESPLTSDSEDESWLESAPSTRPVSRAPSTYSRGGSEADPRSRKPSFASRKSTEKTGEDDSSTTLVSAPKAKPMTHTDSTPTPTPLPQPSSRPPSRPPSVHSDSGQKFTLATLLASGPKLHRRSSQRSNASSKKSDSDGDRRSTAGDSVGSLSKKYGVCERLAIGKGATSVVRLAHKWDRTEEKLYAVKVSSPSPLLRYSGLKACYV